MMRSAICIHCARARRPPAPTDRARPLPQYDEKGNKQEKPDIKACAPPCCICCGPKCCVLELQWCAWLCGPDADKCCDIVCRCRCNRMKLCICCGPQRDDPLWCHCCMCCRGPKTVTADTKVSFNECCECDCIENNCGPRYAGCQLCCCHCTCLRCPAGCQNKCCCEEERMMMDGDLVPFPKEPTIQEMDRT